MANIPVSIRRQPVRGGIEIISVGQTPRGTKYFVDSVVIITSHADRKADNEAVGRAVVKLLGDDWPTR